MKTGFVDFHCPVDLFKDMDSAVSDADAAGIYTLSVTTTPKGWPRNHKLTRLTKRARAAAATSASSRSSFATGCRSCCRHIPLGRILSAGELYWRRRSGRRFELLPIFRLAKRFCMKRLLKA